MFVGRWHHQVDVVKRNTNLRNVQSNYFTFKTSVGGELPEPAVSLTHLLRWRPRLQVQVAVVSVTTRAGTCTASARIAFHHYCFLCCCTLFRCHLQRSQWRWQASERSGWSKQRDWRGERDLERVRYHSFSGYCHVIMIGSRSFALLVQVVLRPGPACEALTPA